MRVILPAEALEFYVLLKRSIDDAGFDRKKGFLQERRDAVTIIPVELQGVLPPEFMAIHSLEELI